MKTYKSFRAKTFNSLFTPQVGGKCWRLLSLRAEKTPWTFLRDTFLCLPENSLNPLTRKTIRRKQSILSHVKASINFRLGPMQASVVQNEEPNHRFVCISVNVSQSVPKCVQHEISFWIYIFHTKSETHFGYPYCHTKWGFHFVYVCARPLAYKFNVPWKSMYTYYNEHWP